MLMRSQTVENKNKSGQHASDEVEHNQTYSFEMAFILAVWRQKVSIMWQIVFTTENGVIDPRRAFNITI